MVKPQEAFSNWSPNFNNQISNVTQTRTGSQGTQQTRTIEVTSSSNSSSLTEESIDKDINNDGDLYEDIEEIKRKGLAKGGSLENAIVVKDEKILNSEGLRNSKEFVNHKILDCIGDFYTTGYRMIASVKCHQGGHFLTNCLLRKVFENKENFSIIEIQERTLPHTLINKSLLRSIA